MTAQQLIDLLKLQPHPKEGGFFRETYRASDSTEAAHLRGDYASARSVSTAIYYLLTPDTFSAMHRLRSDEIFHHYLGDPVEMLLLRPNITGEVVRIGKDIAAGERPQVVVPAGYWQGSRLVRGGSFSLLGCTVAPGFDYADYEHADREALISAFPSHVEQIRKLTNI